MALISMGCHSSATKAQSAPAAPSTSTSPSTTVVPAFEPFEGTYRGADGRTFVVTIQGWWVELASGAARSLASTSTTNDYTYGPGFTVTSPPAGRIHFSVDKQGRATALSGMDASGAAVVAARVPFATRNVSIPSGDAVLAGTVTEPATPGPHPGIVFVHGSGPEVRSQPDVFVNFFASQGFAVLGYDKRGVGQSSGVYPGERATPDSLAIYAEDATTAVRYLHGQPDVDPHRIGFYGGSQAGWVIPLAAEQIPDVAFAVIAVGAPVTVGQQELYAGFSGGGASAPSMSDTQIDASVSADHRGYDPAPSLARLNAPVLWLLGGRDLNVPTRVSVATLAHLAKPNITARVLSTANHALLTTPDGLNSEDAASPGFAPDLFTAVSNWLHAVPGLEPA